MNNMRQLVWSTLVILVMTLGVSPLWAASTAVLNMKDGRVIRGELVERSDEQVVVRMSGISTTISMNDVQSMQVVRSPREDYQHRRAQIADTDVEARYELAFSLFEARELDLALQELQSMQAAFAEEERVPLLIKIIQERKKLQEQAETPATTTGPGPARPDPSTKPSSDRTPIPLLSERDVNSIKIWELPDDFETTFRTSITVPRDVMEQVIRDYAENPLIPKGRVQQQQLLRESGARQLALLFQLRAQNLYADAVMRGDPPALQEYRRHVNQQYVVNYFARHFGEGQVPGLYLITENPRGELQAYTNFYILSAFQYDGQQMINRLQPESSLLLQWGLARALARFPAPDVPGWQPRFRSMDDPMYHAVLAWIRSLFTNADYQIDYRVPLDIQPAPSPEPTQDTTQQP